MIYKKRIGAVACGLLLIVIVIAFNSRTRYDKPWLETGKSGADADSGAELMKELKQAISDPLLYLSAEPDEGVISPIANSTYVMLFVSGSKLWSHTPLHHKTTLHRFPLHSIYSGSGAIIGQQSVIDIVGSLPQEVITQDERLNAYRIERYGIDNAWGWPTDEYWVDSGSLASLVSLSIIKHAWTAAPSNTKWFVLIDESSYILSLGLEKLVEDEDFKSPVVFSAGSSMILSQGAMEALIESDFDVTEGAEAAVHRIASVKPINARNISTFGVNVSDWCAPPPSLFTQLKPWEIQSLYNLEKNQTSHSLYHSYIMPFIEEVHANWVIYPSGPVFTSAVNGTEPHTHREDCRRLCEENDKCVAWQWRKDIECKLELTEVKRGMAFNPKYKGWEGREDQLYVSGWMIDRIRQVRSNSSCDREGESTNIYTNEGWFHKIKSIIKVESSDILQSIKDYNA